MKKLITAVFAALLTVSCTMAQTEFTQETKQSILKNAKNEDIVFSDILKSHKGKPVVIEFWASWCSDCVKAMPKIKELQQSHPEVEYVFVSLDKTYEKWLAGIEKHELKGDQFWVNQPEGMKGAFGKSVNLDWIPRYIIIDKEGKIVLYRAIETDFEKINEALNNLK